MARAEQVWNEVFEFEHVLVFDLLEFPPIFEVMDEDVLSADDSIGHAAFTREDIEKLIHNVRQHGPTDAPRRYTLPLKLPQTKGEEGKEKGALHVSLAVSGLLPPTWKDTWVAALKPLLQAFRAFILYARVPFDRGTWSKLRDWKAILILYIASSTDVLVRGTFFTCYLLSVMVEMEEYQVTRFILAC